MRDRLTLTLIWIGCFLANLLVVESYIHTHDSSGVIFVLPEQRLECLSPLLVLYGGYLTGIIGFWFLKPFAPPKNGQAAKTRFKIALLCTMIFNLAILYLVSQTYLWGVGTTTVEDNVKTAVKLAGGLSFIVAPVNVYYFGMKNRPSH